MELNTTSSYVTNKQTCNAAHERLAELPLTLQPTEGTALASKEQKDYDRILISLLELADNGSASGLRVLLNQLLEARKKTALMGFRNLSARMIKRMINISAHGNDAPIHAMLRQLHRYLALQNRMINDQWKNPQGARELAQKLRDARGELYRLTSTRKHTVGDVREAMGATLVFAVDKGIQQISRAAEVLDTRRQHSMSKSLPAGGRRAFADWLFNQFLSYRALRHTSLEMSWGLRTYVPGSFGFGVNIGPWVMLYSGSVHDYQSQTVPMRINPGATFATPLGVVTYNRPGWGSGPSLPFASAYLDSQRYKLLIGFDGILYVRLGEWEGRGPYVTVSASVPVWPAISLTYNLSIFSPGFSLLVHRSTPIARKIRALTDRYINIVLAPFRAIRGLFKATG